MNKELYNGNEIGFTIGTTGISIFADKVTYNEENKMICFLRNGKYTGMVMKQDAKDINYLTYDLKEKRYKHKYIWKK